MARAILSFAIFIATQIELSIINNNDKETKICIHIVENSLPHSYFLGFYPLWLIANSMERLSMI